MDLIKKLTGKNPSEYEPIAQSLIDNSDVELYSNLVKQDEFLFDFIKENVSRRIQKACNKDNYLNLMKFLNIYSPSYDDTITGILYNFGGDKIFEEMENLFFNGNISQKTYAVKYFSHMDKDKLINLIPELRKTAKSDYQYLAINSIDLLSMLNDNELKDEAIQNLNSNDDFESYNAVKFLVTYGAKETLPAIIKTMKKSGLSENIASEIPYLVPLAEFSEQMYEDSLLVLAHILNSVPEIVSPSALINYELKDFIQSIVSKPLDSISAVILRLAKDKFEELVTNDEYLYDADKSTKDYIKSIYEILKPINTGKLNSYLYDELYEESDFVFFALDYVNEVEELETLLESKNQTLILKTLTTLKEKGLLENKHKEIALKNITNPDIKSIAEVL